MFHWTSKATRNESLLGPSWSVSLNPNCHSEADGTPACTLRVRTYSHLDALRIVFFIRYWSDANCILDSGQWLPNCWPQAIIRPNVLALTLLGNSLFSVRDDFWHIFWLFCDIVFDISFHMLSDIPSDILLTYFDILAYILSDVFFPFLLTYLVSLHREIAHQERTEKDERSTKLTQRIIEYAKPHQGRRHDGERNTEPDSNTDRRVRPVCVFRFYVKKYVPRYVRTNVKRCVRRYARQNVKDMSKKVRRYARRYVRKNVERYVRKHVRKNVKAYVKKNVKKMSERMSKDMSDRMSKDMLEVMSEGMSKDMAERMSKDRKNAKGYVKKFFERYIRKNVREC